MEDLKNTYESYLKDAGGIYFPGILDDERKSDNFLTPIFENITNALEAIKLKYTDRNYHPDDSVQIYLYYKSIENDITLDHIKIQDSGIGFNKKQFFSFTTYKYNQKGFNNKGCGRFQSLLFFKNCLYQSVFKDDDTTYCITFDFSKKYPDTKGIQIRSLEITDSVSTGTSVSLFPEDSDLEYNALNAKNLKEEIIKKYALEFMLHTEGIPKIEIFYYKDSELQDTQTIEKDVDFPTEMHKDTFVIHYKKIDANGEIADTDESAEFRIDIIPFPADHINFNEIYICSKNEAVQSIEFNAFAKDDSLDGKRFLCFVSSTIFDQSSNIDTTRREIRNVLKTEEQLLKTTPNNQLSLFNHGVILQEDIENAVADIFYRNYPLAKEKELTKRKKINFLTDLFGLEDNSRLSIKTSDSSKDILEKYYRSEALKQANIDAEFSEIYSKIITLDTNSSNYNEMFSNLNEELSSKIPLRNKNALSKYMTGRKIVLDLFELTLQKRLSTQTQAGRKEEEKRLHNLLFEQHSDNPYSSNLWLLNEEFIYFRGCSEFQLKQIKDENGNLLFDFSKMSEADKALLDSRDEKRPDIILFPKEGKCIIIELKAPEVRINQYIDQAEGYARIIASCVSPNNKIDMFYTYFIVDKQNLFDIPSEYEEIYNMKDAYFLPSKKIKAVINGERKDVAYMYSEILSYQDIYDRAKLRNKIFVDILSKK